MRLGLVLAAAVASAYGQEQWSAGVAAVDVTPREAIWLSGYANRTRASEGVVQPIFVKAAAFRQGGRTAVLVTSDLQGFDVAMIDEITRRTEQQFGVGREQVVLNYSHNHSAPVTGKVLHLYYNLTGEQQAVVDRYTRWLVERVVEAIGGAVRDLRPAELTFGQGLAGVAVNRRRARPGGRGLYGPVDQDVPVLAIRAPGGRLRGIVFGYSCHTTALSGYQISGDYAGFAQAEVERRYPGAKALFVQGCGGDANPLPRVMGSDGEEALELARMYGTILARAVEGVVRAPMAGVRGELRAGYTVIEVPFRKAPTRAELEGRLAGATGGKRRQIQYLLDKLNREGRLPESHPYPIQVWRLGSTFSFIALTGEVVVDYCLRFKKRYGFEETWVAGYTNELLSYIPSLRVLREGGYEGVEDMEEYGLPAPYGEELEERIAGAVEGLLVGMGWGR